MCFFTPQFFEYGIASIMWIRCRTPYYTKSIYDTYIVSSGFQILPDLFISDPQSVFKLTKE